MNSPENQLLERHWRKQAARTALRFNAACWLAGFLPLAAVTSALFACAILVLRSGGHSADGAWLGFVAALVLAGAIAALRARKRFLGTDEGLVRLDVVLGLKNRLSSARAGIGPWPPARPSKDGFALRIQPVALPLAGCVFVVATALLVPVPKHSGLPTFTPEAPPALQQVEAWVEKLQESQTADPEALQQIRDKIDEFRNRDDMYSHNALEAADTLRQQTGQSIDELKKSLESAASALDPLSQPSGASASQLQEIQQNLGQAIEGLSMGTMPANKELLGELKNFDPSKLNSADAKALQEKLKEGASTCKNCKGGGQGEGEGQELAEGEGKGQTGTGGVDRGPGTVPLGLKKDETSLGTSTTEKLTSDDMSRALPGDTLGVGKSKPNPTPQPSANPASGGAVTSQGSGGEAVWRNDLTPQEREILKKFYK